MLKTSESAIRKITMRRRKASVVDSNPFEQTRTQSLSLVKKDIAQELVRRMHQTNSSNSEDQQLERERTKTADFVNIKPTRDLTIVNETIERSASNLDEIP